MNRYTQEQALIQFIVGLMVSNMMLKLSSDKTQEDHFDFEIQHFRKKPIHLVNEVFMKLDIYERIKKELNMDESDRLANYLQSKVAKMQREYLELLFQMVFESISNKDEIIRMIANGQNNQTINKKIYKTVIQPKFNIIPFNVKSIENILNRVHNIDKRSGRKMDNSNDAATQTGNEKAYPGVDISMFQNSSIEAVKSRGNL